MVWKALHDIGGFKVGDVVPDDKAIAWKAMYAVPCVIEVPGVVLKEAVALPIDDAVVEEPRIVKKRK